MNTSTQIPLILQQNGPTDACRLAEAGHLYGVLGTVHPRTRVRGWLGAHFDTGNTSVVRGK